MKSLMIIGAGFGQIPAIKKAKQLGIHTVCIDKNPSAPGMQIADVSYAIDVVDLEQALEVAKKHRIHGVITMQSDLPVPTIGYINDKLNLKGVTYEVAIACSNKIETRKRLERFGCAQPKFRVIRSEQQLADAVKEIGLPCVVKAPDSSGSRGVVKIHRLEEGNAALAEAKSFSRGEEILVEEYVSGLEFGAQTFSVGGNCEVVLLHNDTLSLPPYMIPTGHSFPFKYLTDVERRQAEQDIKDSIKALGIVDGPANVDLILDKATNRVKIIEIGARIGATCLPELVEYHTGIDWVGATIMNAIGEQPVLTAKHARPVAAMIVEAPVDGKFDGFDRVESQDDLSLIEFEITVSKGDAVSKLRKGTDRIGKVICYGNNVDIAEENVVKVLKSLTIRVIK